MTQDDLIEIGEILKPHGIHGEVSALIYDGVDIQDRQCIVLQIDGLWVPFFLNGVRQRGSESWLLSIDGVTNEADAAEMCRHAIFALRRDVDDGDTDADDELTAGDLIGYKLVDESDAQPMEVGVIADVREVTADNWLFEITTADGREAFVPIADDLITDIDHEAGIVSMNLPAGLLDL